MHYSADSRLPREFLFVGGPLHGEVRMVAGHTAEVPVDMYDHTAMFDSTPPPSEVPPLAVLIYRPFRFRIEGEAMTGWFIVMAPEQWSSKKVRQWLRKLSVTYKDLGV